MLARRGPVDRLRATWDRAETTYITKTSVISASHVLKSLEWQTSCPKLTDLVGLGVGLDLGDGDTTSSRGVDADDLGVGEARVLVGRLVEEVSLHNYLVRNVQRVVGVSIFHTVRAVSCPSSQSVLLFLYSHTVFPISSKFLPLKSPHALHCLTQSLYSPSPWRRRDRVHP